MGSQNSQSTSAPVDPAVRQRTYQLGMDALTSRDNLDTPSYEAPTYKALAVDYGKLQDDLTSGYSAPIARAKALDLKRSNQDAADRGIYTSLNALRLNNDVDERYAPQFAAAGAAATDRRYSLEAADKAGANQAAMENAQRKYEAGWRPNDFRAGLWNGTGGTVSSGVSGGWSI